MDTHSFFFLIFPTDECGIVAQISEPLAAADIPAYYISTFKFDHALVSLKAASLGHGRSFGHFSWEKNHDENNISHPENSWRCLCCDAVALCHRLLNQVQSYPEVKPYEGLSFLENHGDFLTFPVSSSASLSFVRNSHQPSPFSYSCGQRWQALQSVVHLWGNRLAPTAPCCLHLLLPAWP